MNPNLANVKAYLPMHDRDRNDIQRLDWNEPSYKAPPIVLNTISMAVEHVSLNRYPQIYPTQATQGIIDTYNLPGPDWVALFNGSDAALECIISTFIGPGSIMTCQHPTYTQILPWAQVMGATLRPPATPTTDIFTWSPTQALQEMSKCELGYLVTPHNPTGKVTPVHEIITWLHKNPNSILIVDEAYQEFSSEPSITAHLKNFTNLLVIRTLSKAYALAGLRAGYVLGHPRLLHLINKIRNPKQVNIIAQTAIAAVMQHRIQYQDLIRQTQELRTSFTTTVRNLGFEILDSQGNFVLVRSPHAHHLLTNFRDAGYLIRDRNDLPGCQNCFRITIGTPSQMNVVSAILAKKGNLS